jgi:hypothetical protein
MKLSDATCVHLARQAINLELSSGRIITSIQVRKLLIYQDFI